MEGLTTGRIVHMSAEASYRVCRAAIITHVWSDAGMVNLYVFPDGLNETGGYITSVPHADNDASGKLNPTWHWPER